jgi:hypothetical protein
MSIFSYRKPARVQEPRDLVATLRNTLSKLEDEPNDTAQTADLKRILRTRIAELEGRQN